MPEPLFPEDLVYNPSRRPAASLSPELEPLVARLHAVLEQYVVPRKLGHLWSRVEVVLDRRECVVLRPDITFIIEGREAIVTDYVWGPPDMVLEVISPMTYSGKLQERVGLFSAYGVREYWLVQPDQREVALLELAHGGVRRRTLLDDRTPIRTPLFPDFDTPLAELLR
jgi:Uma2 family endonuclease